LARRLLKMCGLGDAAETSAQRNVERKIQLFSAPGRRFAPGRNPRERLNLSESDQKKRHARLSLSPRKWRSQLTKNWSSVYLPTEEIVSRPVFKLPALSRPWSARHFGEKEGATELVALGVQKLDRRRIEISHPRGKAIREKVLSKWLVAGVRSTGWWR